MSQFVYRPCVGITLFNQEGLVFIGRRRSRRAADPAAAGYEWQMPQGGIDGREMPRAAALRELREETGISTVSFLAEAPQWLTYDLPSDLSRRSWKGRYKGQTQRWFAFRFEGDEREINIEKPEGGHKPEFDALAMGADRAVADAHHSVQATGLRKRGQEFQRLRGRVSFRRTPGSGPSGNLGRRRKVP